MHPSTQRKIEYFTKDFNSEFEIKIYEYLEGITSSSQRGLAITICYIFFNYILSME